MATVDPLLPSLLDDPILHALDRAPLGQRFTPEQEAELAQDMEDIRLGKAKLVPHAQIKQEIEKMSRQQGG